MPDYTMMQTDIEDNNTCIELRARCEYGSIVYTVGRYCHGKLERELGYSASGPNLARSTYRRWVRKASRGW